jgi:hypothetical protein
VRSLNEQPSDQELKNMALDHLSEYYFDGVKVTSPVFEVDLNLAKHTGPTVKELTTIQKFSSSLKKVDSDFDVLNKEIMSHGKSITSLEKWKDASVGTIVIWSGKHTVGKDVQVH